MHSPFPGDEEPWGAIVVVNLVVMSIVTIMTVGVVNYVR
jgi:hypothetical protein